MSLNKIKKDMIEGLNEQLESLVNNRHHDEFVATEGQKVFTLSKTYDQFQNRIDVAVGGIPQFSPNNFTESSPTTFTLSEGVPAGVKVSATYFSETQPLGTDLESVVDTHTNILSTTNNLLTTHSTKLDSVTAQLADMVQDVDITVTVGATGNYLTINEAINFLTKKNKQNDKTAVIKLLSGFIVKEQILADGDNLGWIKITSEDATVPINSASITKVNLSLPPYPGPLGSYENIILRGVFVAINNGISPYIDVLFDMDNTAPGKYPFAAAQGGQITINAKKGCINSTAPGLMAVNGGRIYAMGANVSYASAHAVACWRGSYVLFGGGNGTHAGACGTYVDGSSYLEASQADFSNAAEMGMWIDNGSQVSAYLVKATDCGTVGVSSNNASIVSVKHGVFDNAGHYGIRSISGILDAYKASAKNAGITGIICYQSGTINAHEADVTGAATNGIFVSDGGTVNARNVKAQKTIGVNSSSDIRVASGAIVNAHGATGGNNTGKGNMLTGNGIIFNEDVVDNGATFGSTQTIALTNGWSGTLTVSKTSQGMVHVKGQNILIGTTTKFTTIGTLPTEYKPSINTGFQAIHASTSDSYGFIINSATGNVQLVSGIGTGNLHFNFTYRI